MTKYTDHPIAALFPMMTKQELQELADDIRAHGLRESIKVNAEDKILDGRNRLAACKIAGVEPRIEKLNGEDAEAYAISANIARRHLTAGQRALIVAKMYPEPEARDGRGKKSAVSAHFPQVNPTTLVLARRILRNAPDLAPTVLDGSLAFDRAAKQAKDREDLASSNENKMRMLREDARDLADLVKEERMEIDEALAAMKERERKRMETIQIGKQAAEMGLSQYLSNVASIIAATKETEEDFLDKRKIAAVVKATDQLESLTRKGGGRA